MIEPALTKRKVVILSIVTLFIIIVYGMLVNPYKNIWTTLQFSMKPIKGADIPRDSTPSKLPTTSAPQSHAKVVILTYMRSGSTLLGEVFNTDPQAFYWFEPIRAAYGGLYGKVIREPLNLGSHLEIVNRYMSRFEKDKVFSLVTALYGCDTAKWPDELLAWFDFFEKTSLQKALRCAYQHEMQKVTCRYSDALHIAKSIDDNTFPDILQAYWLVREKGVHFMNYTTEEELLLRASLGGESTAERRTIRKLRNIKNCFENISNKLRPCMESEGVKQDCEKANIRAIKTIRMQMDFVGELFHLDPNVKVVHLLRDPRGVENSRSKLGMLRPKGSIALHAKLLCNRILRDLAVKQSLERTFPARIMSIRYEDFVADTNKTINAMYAFLGMTWTRESSDIFLRKTMGKSVDPYLPRRADPQAVADAWKTELTGRDRRSVDAQCWKVYDLLGYPARDLKH